MRLLKTPLTISFAFSCICLNAQQAARQTVHSESIASIAEYKREVVSDPYGISTDFLQRGVKKSDPPGQRKIRIGKALTIAGGILMVSGIALMATADEAFNYSFESGVVVKDQQGALGFLMTTGGIGMIVPGVIVWSKGKKEYKTYQSTGTSLSLGVSKSGAGLRFRF